MTEPTHFVRVREGEDLILFRQGSHLALGATTVAYNPHRPHNTIVGDLADLASRAIIDPDGRVIARTKQVGDATVWVGCESAASPAPV